jgi:hypothetical protein
MTLAVPWLLKEVLDYGLAQKQVGFLWLAGALLVAMAAVRGIATFGQH